MFRVGGSSSPLPDEMLDMISKYLGEDKHSLSGAISGCVPGFASFFGRERARYGILLGPGCYFLKPSSWDAYFTQYICPESMTKFSANHSYWLPGSWLCDNILKLQNLQDLSIKDTKISLLHLARMLKTCSKITKLDFSYQHEEGFVKTLVEHPLSAPSVIGAFNRLTHLKVTTCVLDAKDFLNDPWIFIIKLLSWCQVCVELTVDITYDGEFDEYDLDEESSAAYENEIVRHVQEHLIPRLTWMKSLQTLVLMKHGPFKNFGFPEFCCVRSRLLDLVLTWMFAKDPYPPHSLALLWVQQFHFPSGLLHSIKSIAPSMKAYRADELDGFFILDDLRDLEHISWVEFNSFNHLANLKSAHGWTSGEPQEMMDFIRTHPNLEQMTIHYKSAELEEGGQPFYVPNSSLHLLKLKMLSCFSSTITKEMVDDFVKVYPNLETVRLESLLTMTGSTDEDFQIDEECLAGLRFKRLTSISLSGFHLNGSFLIPIIENCPKLERVHLERNTISLDSSFLLHLDLFLGQASELELLKDLGLKLDLQRTSITDASLVLKSLESCASHLERLVICFEAFPEVSLSHPFTGFVIDFVKKMERLVALCFVFRRYGGDGTHDAMMTQINRRVAEEIIPKRPALWFHLGSDLPNANDPDVPLIHYREMVYIDQWNHPIEF